MRRRGRRARRDPSPEASALQRELQKSELQKLAHQVANPVGISTMARVSSNACQEALDTQLSSEAVAAPPAFHNRLLREVRREGRGIFDGSRIRHRILEALSDENENRLSVTMLSSMVSQLSFRRADVLPNLPKLRLPGLWTKCATLEI
jgi:hypothetical protein